MAPRLKPIDLSEGDSLLFESLLEGDKLDLVLTDTLECEPEDSVCCEENGVRVSHKNLLPLSYKECNFNYILNKNYLNFN